MCQSQAASPRLAPAAEWRDVLALLSPLTHCDVFIVLQMVFLETVVGTGRKVNAFLTRCLYLCVCTQTYGCCYRYTRTHSRPARMHNIHSLMHCCVSTPFLPRFHVGRSDTTLASSVCRCPKRFVSMRTCIFGHCGGAVVVVVDGLLNSVEIEISERE